MDSRWKLKREYEDGALLGYVVTFDGHDFGMAPRPKAEAKAYLERVAERWPGDSGYFLTGQTPEQQKVRKGGPWLFTYPDGETKVVHTARKSDALSVERHRLKRKRLPAGTKVERWEE